MRRFNPFVTALALPAAACLALAGCDGDDGESPGQAAIAEIVPTTASASSVSGEALFTQDGGSVMLTVDIRNAAPGLHAVHIHETGDCSAPDGTSAGGHWNPTDEAHGRWGGDSFHLGDLGNVPVGSDGTGYLERTTDLWDIGTGSDRDIVGKAIIVHAGEDDFASQPSGAAGGRIACGVIGLEAQVRTGRGVRRSILMVPVRGSFAGLTAVSYRS